MKALLLLSLPELAVIAAFVVIAVKNWITRPAGQSWSADA